MKASMVMLGAPQCGKTTVLAAALRHSTAVAIPNTAAFTTASHRVRVHVWDPLGNGAYVPAVRMHIYAATCAVLVYDTTRLESVDELLHTFVPLLAGARCAAPLPVVLIGTKTDLTRGPRAAKHMEHALAQLMRRVTVTCRVLTHIQVSVRSDADCRMVLRWLYTLAEANVAGHRPT